MSRRSLSGAGTHRELTGRSNITFPVLNVMRHERTPGRRESGRNECIVNAGDVAQAF